MIQGKDIRASLKLRTKRVDVMLPDGNACQVRLLSASDFKDAELDAYAALSADCKKRGIDLVSFVDVEATTLDIERKIAVLHRAFSQEIEGENKPVFSADILRGYDTVYISALFEVYLVHQDSMGAQDPIGDDDLDAVVEGVTDDEKSAQILGRVSPQGLRRIIRALAARLRDAGAE